jgi:hypothetical protein
VCARLPGPWSVSSPRNKIKDHKSQNIEDGSDMTRHDKMMGLTWSDMTRHQRAPNKADFLLKSSVCFLEQISSTLLTHLLPKDETTTTSKTCFVITTLQEMLLTHLWLTVKSGTSEQHLGRRILSATRSSSRRTKKKILQEEVSKCWHTY